MSDERLMMTPQELAERNGADLLAHQLQSELRDKIKSANDHAEEMQAIRSQLDEAQRVGIKVMRAHHEGRKTVRIADLIRLTDD